MNDALYIAATGMQAQQQSLDNVANNLANVSTPAFKKGRVNFQEMMQLQARPHGEAAAHAAGIGISVSSVLRDFSAGQLSQTGNAMDLAINGAGFIELSLPDGSRGYSRGGSLQVGEDGFLSTLDGLPLKPAIHIPAGSSKLSIAADGKVSVHTAQSGLLEIGQIELVNFANASGLHPHSKGIYTPTEASGQAIYGRPGSAGLGELVQGSLEGANVSLVDEMVSLMMAQRAYELSSKVIQTSDELMSLTNNLRR
ncbi:flagellar basal-body rod protein FlgG [Chitinimonas sp.]|uniref:flagellar basal-body rod protein FlgG n=1 Tax=Chitinimonas sp. TaxID=1934313 RepID=UPI0035B0037D